MTPEQINVAIAEWCGWTFKTLGDGVRYPVRPDKSFPGIIPDYYHDLNAIHEAVSKLNDRHKYTDDVRSMFYDYLALGCDAFPDKWEISWHCTTATAPQRCEALLRTLNLWKPTP